MMSHFLGALKAGIYSYPPRNSVRPFQVSQDGGLPCSAIADYYDHIPAPDDLTANLAYVILSAKENIIAVRSYRSTTYVRTGPKLYLAINRFNSRFNHFQRDLGLLLFSCLLRVEADQLTLRVDDPNCLRPDSGQVNHVLVVLSKILNFTSAPIR